MYNANMINAPRVIADGIMMVYYFGRFVALINAEGKIIWRDERYPLFLVDHIIKYPDPTPEQVRLN